MRFLCGFILLWAFHALAFRALDPELSDYNYPYPVSFFEVKFKAEKLQMAYMDVAPARTTGSVVVLFHGKNFGSYYWRKTMESLIADGHRVIAVDQIGFGKSSKPSHMQYSFPQLAQWTQELLRSQGVKQIHLVGHSMGGMLATRFALMYPQTVEKLVLVNPLGLEDWKALVPYRSVEDTYQSELAQNEERIRQYMRDVYFAGQWRPEYDALIEVPVGQTLHGDYPKVAWNSALAYDMIFTQPVVYEFRNLAMPTMLLIGTRDRTAVGRAWAPAAAREKLGRYDILGGQVARLIPRGRLLALKDVGHVPMVESFDQYITGLKAFLK